MRQARGADTPPPGELAAWRQAYAADLRQAAGGCPSEERLVALAVDELSGAERIELADHVVVCPRCAETHRTLRELHEAVSVRGRPYAARRSRRRAWLLGGVAAAIVAAVGLAVIQRPWLPAPAPADVVRGAAGEELTTEPADGARLIEPPERLSWTFAEEAADAVHQVVLYDAEAVPVWQSDPAAVRTVELPSGVRQGLGPGTYYWRIRTGHGVERSETRLVRFEIAP